MTGIRRVGILGGGLIGLSWSALFLARGCEVTILDPDPQVKVRHARFLQEAWPHLDALGLVTVDAPAEVVFGTDTEVLKGAQFIQECGPERLETKRAILESLEKVIGPEVVIASSTSSLRASDLQEGARHPQRILVAHPMNPPHLIPMVEMVAGRQTGAEAMDEAEAFYRAMQRVTLRVKKEVPGHLANRLTSALYREAVHLVAEGIADVEDIDRAVAYGPGLRWALMGPHLIYHLGGGAKGLRGYLDHLGPTQEKRWESLGTPRLTEETKAELVAGVERELAALDAESLVERRDAALVALVRLKADLGL